MSELTGRERLLRVFRGELVDRIPVAPFIHVNFVKEFYGSHGVDWVARTPDVYRHFGFDLIHRNCTPVYDALGPDGPEWQREVCRCEEGRDETTFTVVHTPAGGLQARECLRWTYEYDAESSLVEYPIRDEADFESLEMRAYESLTPLPYDDTDLEEAVRIFGSGTTLSGNVDQISLLRTGSPAEIELVVKQVLDTVRGRVPFILATTDYFNDGMPHDAIHALAESGHRYGAV